jgi:SecD/SecF fusion protein
VRKYRGKIILILAVVGLALWFLYPTYEDYQFSSALKQLSGEDSLTYFEQHEDAIREARAGRVKLGLDLQGGMRVVLEVNVLKLLDDLARNKDAQFAEIVNEVREQTRISDESPVLLLRRKFDEKQIRMSRYYRSIRDTNEEIQSYLEDEATKAIDRAIQIVRNRVDQYGVSEPTIQKMGGTRIIVELPGVTNEADVTRLLQGTALLEFKLLRDPDVSYRVMQAIDRALAAIASGDTSILGELTDTAAIKTPEGDLTPEQFAKQHPFFTLAIIVPERFPGAALVAEENRDRVRRILEREEIKRLIPGDMQFAWSAKPERIDNKLYYILYALKERPELTGGVIVDAREQIEPTFNQAIVTMEMNSEGAREWARITGANVDKQIAIVLDNAVFSAPVVRNKIIGGRSQIEGMDGIEEARLLAIVLRAGALPAPVQIVEQRTVGPSLGEDSIRKGLFSVALATGLTVIFMAVYYRSSGLVANGALVFCVLFIMGILASFQGTLTLPGIAGIILTLAVAVDANVLIFERVREELGTGKTIRAAIDEGYKKAFTAILDSNLTTFVTGLILYQFGSGPVQGFALTLMIGIASSMFSAIFITRVVFDMITEKSPAAVSFG